MARVDARTVPMTQPEVERVPIPLAALMIATTSASMWAGILYVAFWLLG